MHFVCANDSAIDALWARALRKVFAFRVFEFIWAVSSGDCTTLRDWSSFAWSCEGSQNRLNIWTCGSTHESRQAGAPELDTDWRITPIGGERDQRLRKIGAESQTANGLLFSVWTAFALPVGDSLVLG